MGIGVPLLIGGLICGLCGFCGFGLTWYYGDLLGVFIQGAFWATVACGLFTVRWFCRMCFMLLIFRGGLRLLAL